MKDINNNELKAAFWNIHHMTQSVTSPGWVSDIITKYPITALTEYTTDDGIESALEEGFVFDKSSTSKNEVLIAIRKDLIKPGTEVEFKEFDIDGIASLVATFCFPNDQKLTVVGIRYVMATNNTLEISKKVCSELKKLDGPWIIGGDFNIHGYRMPFHFRGFVSNFYCSKDYGKDLNESSIMMVDSFANGKIQEFARFDHVFASGLDLNTTYDWDFTKNDSIYPTEIKVGKTWKIPAGMPDHALMVSDIKFI